jgi:glycosyltransferase involved in cell wall biosynthesis
MSEFKQEKTDNHDLDLGTKFAPSLQKNQDSSDWENLSRDELKLRLKQMQDALNLERNMHAEWIGLVTDEVSRIFKRLEVAQAERDSYLRWVREVEAERDVIATSTLWRSLTVLRTALKYVSPQARQLFRASVALLNKSKTEVGTREQEKADNDIQAELETPFNRDYYARWIANCDALSDEDRSIIRHRLGSLSYRPTLSIIMPVYETPKALLEAAIASVERQLYPDWELCIADDASTSPYIQDVLEQAASRDSRIRFVRRADNGNISAASNTALQIASGDFLLFLDHDDILAEKALFEIALELNNYPSADIIFSDEDRLDDKDGSRHSPYFKPDWDPDLILSQNFVCHLSAFRRSLINDIGGFRLGFEGSQDHDLILRASRATSAERIRHIPSVLYHWRLRGDASFSDTQLQRCVIASRQAVEEHLQLIPGGQGAHVLPHPHVPNYHRVQWALPDVLPRVSVIIPTRDHAILLRECTNGVLYKTDYKNIELVVIDNSSSEPSALALLEELDTLPNVTILRDNNPFNYSALNNIAANAATGEILVLLNNDIEVIKADWLKEMVSQVVRPGVGTVGARLLYGNGTVQHAGVTLGTGEFSSGPGVAGHFGLNEASHDPGYFAHSMLARTVCASTAACLAVRREVFKEFGGFDEVHLPVAFNDVDFCLRVREAGLRNVWTPFAELLHLESATRGEDDSPDKKARVTFEGLYMRKRWGHLLDRDPYYNANFSRRDSRYSLLLNECRTPPWR